MIKQHIEPMKKEGKKNKEEKQENNVLPVVGGTTGIILVIVFFLTRNVTVYNYKDGEYKKVGKVRATKAGKIKLDRFSLFETTNKYKLELSKNLTKKLKGKMITVSKNGTTIKMLVNSNEKETNNWFGSCRNYYNGGYGCNNYFWKCRQG